MIVASVFYPNQPGLHFDIEYYRSMHMQLVQRLLGPAVRRIEVEHGVAGMGPGAPAPYLAIGRLYFESLEVFQKIAVPQLAELTADIPNYTNSSPILQISELKD